MSEDVSLDDLQSQYTKDWVRQRVVNIHEKVAAYDVLTRFGVSLRYGSREEQFSCPFHGKDTKPSARYYPESGTKHSHAWCFVCQESWDAIKLWRKFNDDTIPFTVSLAQIEKAYGIETPDLQRTQQEAQKDEELEQLFSACESRLVANKQCFAPKGYLTLCVLLDRLYEALEAKESGTAIKLKLRAILDKIGDKCRGS